jgi:FkbM family methyltransferase
MMNLPTAACEPMTLPHADPSEMKMSIFQKVTRAAARFIFGKLLPRWPYPVVRGPLRGNRFILGATAGEAGGVSVHLGIQEVEQTQRLTELLRPGQTFFDVGANVGFYSLLGSRLVRPNGSVMAFEPSPRNIAFLHRHIALNHADNITVVPLACAQDESTATFVTGENNSLGHLANTENEKANTVIVGTVSLDTAVTKFGTAPDVIKIDVEGGEFDVLHGAAQLLASHRPIIFLSTHSDELRQSCLQYLCAHGYDLEPLNSATIESATEFVAQFRLPP